MGGNGGGRGLRPAFEAGRVDNPSCCAAATAANDWAAEGVCCGRMDAAAAAAAGVDGPGDRGQPHHTA